MQVTRDAQLREFQAAERIEVTPNFGSGYPGGESSLVKSANLTSQSHTVEVRGDPERHLTHQEATPEQEAGGFPHATMNCQTCQTRAAPRPLQELVRSLVCEGPLGLHKAYAPESPRAADTVVARLLQILSRRPGCRRTRSRCSGSRPWCASAGRARRESWPSTAPQSAGALPRDEGARVEDSHVFWQSVQGTRLSACALAQPPGELKVLS